jgi:hypothetical protein
MSDYSTRNIIDYAFDGDGIKFREELYGSIHDRVSAHIDAKKQEVARGLLGQNEEVEELDEARSTNLQAGGVGNEVHMAKWIQDHTKKSKLTGTPDAWNEYYGKGTVTHLGKDGHVKVKSHDTGKIHKFDYYGKGMGPESQDMSVRRNKDDIHSLRNVKEEVEDLDEDLLDDLSLEEIQEFMQTEDYEKLDETGKAKLVMYMTKAGADRSLTGYKKGMDTGRAIGKGMDYSATSKSMDKLDAKRSRGMNTAAIKLANKTNDPTKYASGKVINSEGISIKAKSILARLSK